MQMQYLNQYISDYVDFIESEYNLNIKIDDIRKLMFEKRVVYDHNVDQRGFKWSGRALLKKVKYFSLPGYISENLNKYKDWLD